MLSLCMIVKNEEKNLKSCLSKVAPFIDEIIIVDTGSTDATKTVAEEFTDKIYEFRWCDDFSKARNFSIEKASNDWILVLDADEYIMEFDKESVSSFIQNSINQKNVGRIKLLNVIEDSLGIKKYIERVSRLFNRKHFQYKGIIHEQITPIIECSYETLEVDIFANHIGYTKEELKRTNKLNRNIELLNIAMKNDLNDSYILYQLGKSYFVIKDYNKAIIYFEKTLLLKPDFKLEYVSDLVETYGYSLINSNRFSEALLLEQWVDIYNNIPDFHFVLGLIYMNNAKFIQAIESFLNCTKSNQGKIEGITTYLPYYNIGVIFDVLGHREQSIEYYRKCGNYSPALIRLSTLTN